MLYSSVDDIRMGDLPWPSFIDKDLHMQNVTDEIDSYIGFMYDTPIDISETGPVSRPAILLLKRISISLSTGRAVLEAAAAVSDERLHAYGRRLVDEALSTLRSIAKGDIELDGADKIIDEKSRIRGPVAYNEDPYSQVEAFYGHISRPSLSPSVRRRFR